MKSLSICFVLALGGCQYIPSTDDYKEKVVTDFLVATNPKTKADLSFRDMRISHASPDFVCGEVKSDDNSAPYDEWRSFFTDYRNPSLIKFEPSETSLTTQYRAIRAACTKEGIAENTCHDRTGAAINQHLTKVKSFKDAFERACPYQPGDPQDPSF